MMFERTFDYALVRQIMTHPRIYPHISDDFSPPAAEFRPVEHEGIWYVLVDDEGKPLGVFVFVPQGGVCWEVHTCLLPEAWGERAGRIAREVARWIWRHTVCQRIVTTVPVYNRLALRFAKSAGMTEYGRNPESIQKGGQLHDQILLGLSRPKEVAPCQPQ